MTGSPGKNLKIAVVGGGAAGITAACLLQEKHEVTLYERDKRLGGHAHSQTINGGDEASFEVDTAFVIFNSESYPLFLKLLDRFKLGARVRRAEMSFSYEDRATGEQYALNRGPAAFFGRKRSLFSPFHWRLCPELLRFRRNAALDLVGRKDLQAITLADYLASYRYARGFLEHFLCPTAVAVWSLPGSRIRELPALTFLRFLDNHRYLSGAAGGRRGRWLTLEGGCQQYVRAFEASFTGRVRKSSEVVRILRSSDGPEVFTADGRSEKFDRVIIAAHADQALHLLGDPSEEENRLLGAWRYHKTHTVLHTDPSRMPARRKLWASWNIQYDSHAESAGRAEDGDSWVTYWLNRVQGLPSRKNCFVTLGPRDFDEAQVLARFDYEHPILDFRSTATQAQLARLNGQRGTYFCGSYFGFGFHEDAIRSATEVAKLLEK